MSYKPCDPSVYVVAWDTAGIVKAGYSGAQRWRRFQLRGARLVHLWPFESVHAALAVESWCHDRLAEIGSHAFESLPPSRPFVGRDGAGWRECWRVNPAAAESMLRDASEQCSSIRASHPCMSNATYGRTDGRTNEEASSSIMHLLRPYHARAYAAALSQPSNEGDNHDAG